VGTNEAMTTWTLDGAGAMEGLEARLRTILPEEYQDCYEDVQPVSMGSAGLKYGTDGKVAWNEMWETFCDLAMAGGPPHKGTLLEPGTQAEIEVGATRYTEVTTEICRGVNLVTDIDVQPAAVPGWVRVPCESEAMAGWLARAIAMENVSVRLDGAAIELPAGPAYRIEKEIKNVVTVIAKTSHYWLDHMWSGQQKQIAELFRQLAVERPLIAPAVAGYDFQAEVHQARAAKIAVAIEQQTGLRRSDRRYAGWLGVECTDVAAAIWMMRALVASNVMARREDAVLFVPVQPDDDPTGEIVVDAVAKIHALSVARAAAQARS
jgi:sirohydrochlorin cobaltochelatase